MWHKCEAFFLFFGNHFHVKYNTLYFIFIKCVLCEAVGSADQNHKTFKTFLFFTRKKKQKNLTSATSAKGICSHGSFKNGKGQVVFFEKFTQKISTLNPCHFYFVRCVFRTESRTQQNQNLLDFRF